MKKEKLFIEAMKKNLKALEDEINSKSYFLASHVSDTEMPDNQIKKEATKVFYQILSRNVTEYLSNNIS